MIPFSIDGTTYYEKKSMTFEEWINSNLYEKNSGILISNRTVTKNGLQVFDGTEYVIGENIIIENKNYITNNRDIAGLL